jgi:adenylate cyclase
MALTVPLLTSEGYMSPRLGEALARAWDICQRSGDDEVPALVLHYLATHHAGRGEYARSLQIARRLLEVGERAGDEGLVHAAHYAIGFALFMQGELGAGLAHFEKVVDWYEPTRHRALDLVYGMSLGVFSLCWAAMAQWMRGRPDRALASGREASAMARALDHPLSLTLALLCGGSFLHDFRREPEMGLECAQEGLRLATEHALGYHAIAATAHCVIHLAALGRHEEALGLVHANAEAARSATPMFLPRILYGVAMAMRAANRHQEALGLLGEALSVGEATRERLTLAEVLRARGELLWEVGDDPGAERDFQRALEIARGQEARSWELRAATSLARLWHEQGRTAEAWAMLEPVYGWFTEGIDTGDLREAKELLGLLSPA